MDFRKKCPVCDKICDDGFVCEHLLLILRNDLPIVGPIIREDFIDTYNENLKNQVAHNLSEWTNNDLPEKTDDYSQDQKNNIIINPNELIYFSGANIIPVNWGKYIVRESCDYDLLYEIMQYTGNASLILSRFLKYLLDGFSAVKKTIKRRTTYMFDEHTVQEFDRSLNIYLYKDKNLNFDIEYWRKDEQLKMPDLDEYLRLFFFLKTESTLFNKVALSSTLDEIARIIEKNDPKGNIDIPNNIFNQIYFSVGKKGPIQDSLEKKTDHPILAIIKELFSHFGEYDKELSAFKAFMNLLGLNADLHNRIKSIWVFLTDYSIDKKTPIDDIINIENQFNPLRKCIEELEAPIFTLGNTIKEWKNTNKNTAKLNLLYENGMIDRFLKDSLLYIYGLMSWKSHAEKEVDKKHSVSHNPYFLHDILWKSFEIVFYYLLPKSTNVMLQHNHH